MTTEAVKTDAIAIGEAKLTREQEHEKSVPRRWPWAAPGSLRPDSPRAN
ncbi:hypothetical protein [Arthrobacter sp. MMS18-M83]|nr:hypothetical protein [Arthrobacter sp. MMS18-M83]WAH97356.1 hypothetical protein OW521_00130 [Arthrobacter sp. MMS18-M83]